MWDDCDEPDCSMCESECSQVPEYEWFGSYWAMDPPMERCMMYKPGKAFVFTTPLNHTTASVDQCVVQLCSTRSFYISSLIQVVIKMVNTDIIG